MTKKQRLTFTDQIRREIDAAGISRYAIWKAIGIDQSVLSRFMAGHVGMELATLDVLADFLGLEVVSRKAHRGRPKQTRSRTGSGKGNRKR